MTLPNWSPKPPQWSTETNKLLLQDVVSEPAKQRLKDIIDNSDRFPVKFPVDTGRCKTLKNNISQNDLERYINSVYPVIHESALELYCRFILHKRRHGSAIEKSLFKKMTLLGFINRLLKKRAVTFVGNLDYHILLSGDLGANKWETIGTNEEQAPLLLENYISYDEIKLSAFLSVSSYTYFINIGDRRNNAKYADDRRGIEDEGIIVGLIGTRLSKANVMEYQEIIISEKQNRVNNGYGTNVNDSVHKVISSFYDEPCYSYSEILNYRKSLPKNDERYVKMEPYNIIFDNHMYYKRLSISIDTLLMEANFRAKSKGTTAYIHVVGLGLGVWKISPHQDKVYMDAFAKRLDLLGKSLASISDICFAYIKHDRCGDYKHGDIFAIDGHLKSGIKIHIFNREPHAKLLNEDAEKLLVVSYAWDGNALPGNEYWSGALGNSSDSAAASSTQITEIHNPHINPLVDANNIRVITKDDVIPFKKYQDIVGSKVS